MRLLISVRSVEEARLAARGGADFIDLKEPGTGALGGLPIATIEAIVTALRRECPGLPLSATIGDLPADEAACIRERVLAVAACGVDLVKVGIQRTRGASALLQSLADCGSPAVPVLIADDGVDLELVGEAAALGFPALMLDTANKRAGSLFDVASEQTLRRFVRCVQAAGALAGLAGALRIEHAARLEDLAPDFAGFRSAVCEGERITSLDAGRLAKLRMAFSRPCVDPAPPVRCMSPLGG